MFTNCPGFWDVVKPCKVELDFCSKLANIEKKSEHTYSIDDIVYTIVPTVAASGIGADGGIVLGTIKGGAADAITGGVVEALLDGGLGIILTAALFYFKEIKEKLHLD